MRETETLDEFRYPDAGGQQEETVTGIQKVTAETSCFRQTLRRVAESSHCRPERFA